MRELRTAEIIAVGSELLTPYRADTNSLYLTARLNECGVDVRAKCIVGDDRDELAALFEQALSRTDLVITTGGLGPTDDDVTREVVAHVLGLPLHEDAELLASIRERFAQRSLRMPEINRRQARVPRGATPLLNPKGTAPGLWIDAADRVVVLLPGPPRELQLMFERHVSGRVVERTGGRRLRRRVIKLTGRAESHVDEIAQPIYATLRDQAVPVHTTILAVPGQIELHLSAHGSDTDLLDRTLETAVGRLTEALGPAVFSVDGRTLEEVTGYLLRERAVRIGVAESCTGGLLLARLTDVPGSSAWVVGGVVAYANNVKIDELGVPAGLIADHGAVSEPVAQAMAEGVTRRLRCDVGVAVTGIAGPTGGTPTKPVGTVVLALAGPDSVVKTMVFPGDRQQVRQSATTAALEMVRRALLRASP